MSQRSTVDYREVLSLALDVGIGLLSCGASVSRVETAVYYICTAYGIKDIHSFAIPSMITASATCPDGQTHTLMKRIYVITNDFTRMERFNQLSRDIAHGRYTLEEAQKAYCEVNGRPSMPRYVELIGGALIASMCSIFFGGTWQDIFPTAIVGVLMTWLNSLLSGRSFNSYASAFVLSLVGGTSSILLCRLGLIIGLQCHLAMIVIGSIMIVVPGMLVCNAIRDLFAGDIVTGSFQILNGLLITLAIVAGYSASLFVLRNISVSVVPDARVMKTLLYYLYLVPSGVFLSLGFCAQLRVAPNKLGWTMANAVLTLSVYFCMEAAVSDLFIVHLVTTIAAATCAECFARLFKAPATVFFVPAIIPFVPGGSLYYCIYYLVNGQKDLSSLYGNRMGLIFLGIAVGLSLVTLVFQIVAPVKNQIHIRSAKLFKFNHNKR